MQRKQLIENLNQKLRQWDERLESVENELAAKRDDGRSYLDQQRARLVRQRASLAARLESAEQSVGAGWQRTADGLDQAWNEFQHTAQEVYESLRA